jgi:succinate dehydrogenase / fumarate reductase flavoprotein subunit
VFGKRAGEYAADFARLNGSTKIDDRQVGEAAAAALAPFERGAAAENPYKIQQDLQGMMQDLVGIVREEREMRQALDGLDELKGRAARAGVTGHREYNPGWHTSLDLSNLLTVSEAIARSALERKESRGGHTRDDHPYTDDQWGTVNLVQRLHNGSIELRREPLPQMPPELKALFQERK